MMKINPMWYVVALTVTLAACSSASGPAFNAYQVNAQGEQATYRVECHGLLEGQQVCQRKAQEICGGQAVRPVEPVTLNGRQDADVRTLTFQCGTRLESQKPQSVVTAPPVEARRLSLAGDANFETDKAALTPSARQKLDKLVTDAQGQSFGRVEVDGYTDSRASAAHNLALSRQRASSVARYLREHGLQGQSWLEHGHGAAEPVASNATAQGRAQNRRVEISLNP